MPPSSAIRAHFDSVAENDARLRRVQGGFHSQLQAWHQRVIPPGARVLECGCGVGKLLRAVAPAEGFGVDVSGGMIARARDDNRAEPRLRFMEADVQNGAEWGQFDYIIASFLIGYLLDIEAALRALRPAAHARTRLVITSLNNLWLWPLKWAQWLGLISRQPESNWLSRTDLINLLELSGWEVVETGCEQLFPFRIPLLAGFLNRVVVRLPGFRHLGMTITVIARPRTLPELRGEVTCSVVVPARNESGNIKAALERIPVLGQRTEVIFVEGNSKDDTWDVIQNEAARYTGPHLVKILKQPGRGKWDAVRSGLAVATGDILVIQDADLTAPPEDLPKFYAAIEEGVAEFANGCRLVYPMEKQAMRFLNFLGNKFFALSLGYVLGQPIKDSLCGTKMLLRSDYERLQKRIVELGDFDPFGDFNLLFGSALLKLKIRDIPVRYKDRTYGETNISRFRHGWLLLKMTAFGLIKLRWR